MSFHQTVFTDKEVRKNKVEIAVGQIQVKNRIYDFGLGNVQEISVKQVDGILFYFEIIIVFI